MNEAPKEILVQIFSFLRLDEKWDLQLVNYTWKNALNDKDVWKDILKQEVMDYKELDSYFVYYAQELRKRWKWKKNVYLTKVREFTIVKCVIIGQSHSGRSSLHQRMSIDTFTSDNRNIQTDLDVKIFDIRDQTLKLHIWDSASYQNQLIKLTKSHFNQTSIILLCFDLNYEDSIKNFSYFTQKMDEFDYQGDVLLVGCKCDLEQKVKNDDIHKFTKSTGVKYFKTSSKTGQGCKELMEVILKTIEKNIYRDDGKNCFTNEVKNTKKEPSYCQIQ